MTYEAAMKKMTKCSQQQVLEYWNKLGKRERAALLTQIEKISTEELERCTQSLKQGGETFDSSKGKAPKVAELRGSEYEKMVALGEKELAAGRVAALLVAGGQGSRLGFEGPKGCFPIGPITNRPLFYFHARKILAKTISYGKPIPFYVMTSEANNAATIECFEENDYFGLDRRNVFFFTQGMWPGMTKDGKIILDKPGHIFMSPDGHGGLLAALKASGALADMKRRGIKSVFFFQVDNPQVEIADPAFIGYHVHESSEYTLKLCAKRDPFEKVGIPMRFGKIHRMVEYTEMSKAQCTRKERGRLYYLYGSPAIHVFDRGFLEREALKAMPLHLAFKKIPQVEKGKVIQPKEPNGYKFEKFIFDVMPNAKKVAFMAFEQKQEFSPVKNADGVDSPATAKADMQEKWRSQLAQAGVLVAEGAKIEVDPIALA